jgi:tryptophan synthase alpha chain
MSRIQQTFEHLAADKRKALIPFITAGDPAPGITVPLMHALAEAGADILELGVPNSYPMADGPVILRASERALKHGIGLNTVLDYVHEFRARDQRTPVVLMGYANPIEAMGVEVFAARAQTAGVDGVLVVDYPPEECASFSALMKRSGIDLILLLAPTSTEQRIAHIVQLASGYIYYVALKGVTGAAILNAADVATKLQSIRAKTKLPLGVGFGIRDGETARAVAAVADAVVIGSRLIQEMEQAGEADAVKAAQRFIAGIREALDRP